ncbi:MAG: hypothetical protein ABIN91_08675 [Mucilaginibacter sp.]|uniref:hypothetical protein n=1 Tax=Mucilaginibacter sp. TaxID=1882438 RepID=UPI00326581D1
MSKPDKNTIPRYSIPTITVILCCFSLFLHAQRQEFMLKGVVFKAGNIQQRLSKVLVANLNSTGIVTTDDLGIFNIQAAVGDTLLFRQKDYADQKVAVTGQSTAMVFMQTNITLNQVDIKGLTKRQELQGVMKEYNSQGIYSNGKPSVASAILSPLNGLYDLFGSGPKQARRFARFSAADLEQTEVDRRFTKSFIQRITGITDTIKLQAFKQAYRPSYEDIKSWNDYDLINYTKRSYTDFVKNGEKAPDNGLQKLVPVTPPQKPE